MIDSTSAETLLCLEFKIIKDPKDRLAAFRMINQDFSESNFFLELTGYIHGKRILVRPITVNLYGKKLIKSVQERINDYKMHLKRAGWTHETKQENY